MLRKYLSLTGVYLRNKKIYDAYDFLLESQHWDIDSLREYQLKKLKELIFHAYNNCEFYRNRFDRNGVCPQDIQS